MNPEEKLYTTELTFLCYGLPIWEPDPMGLYDRVRIGDVGYIEDGKFIPLFNILPPHPESNPDDRFLIARPAFWQPLLLPSNPDPNIPTRFTHNTNPLSPRVYARESALAFSTSMAANSAGSVGIGEFSLSFTKERGAALVLPFEARRENTLYKKKFAKHMLANYRQWECFVVDQYNIALSDLILVTGCDMTRQWAMATYDRSSREVTATLGTQVPGIVEAKFSLTAGWRTAHAVGTRQGPPEEIGNRTEQLEPANNQCIFLRGFYLKRRLRIFSPKVLKAGAGYHDPGKHDPDEGEVDMLVDNDLTVESLTLSINRDNLITVLLDYMLEECNADVVIAHDSDLWPYLEDLTNSEDLHETLKRKCPSINLKVENGVGWLDTEALESRKQIATELGEDYLGTTGKGLDVIDNNLGESFVNLKPMAETRSVSTPTTNNETPVPNRVLIAVMGATGTGKSTFISTLTDDDNIHINHGLETDADQVKLSTYFDPDNNCYVTLIDTPGFDEFRNDVSDTDILRKIVDFLQQKGGQQLNGLIYMHRISDPRMGGISKRNLRMLKQLCGEGAFKNVCIATTNWDRVTKEEGGIREQELCERPNLFKPLIDEGAQFARHDKGIISARSIVNSLINKDPTKLQIQAELDAGMSLENTSTGAALQEEILAHKAMHKARFLALEEELEEAAKERHAELLVDLLEVRKQLEAQRKKMEEDLKNLKVQAQSDKAKHEAQ